MAQKTDKHPAFIKVYFTGYNESLQKQIETLANDYSMSASIIACQAIRLGLPMVKKQMDGLFPDTNPEPRKENS